MVVHFFSAPLDKVYYCMLEIKTASDTGNNLWRNLWEMLWLRVRYFLRAIGGADIVHTRVCVCVCVSVRLGAR